MTRLLTAFILSSLLFVPAPVVDSGDPFIFDPNECDSPVMGAFVIPMGVTKTGILEVYEPDGEDVVVTAGKIVVSSVPTTVKDGDDPLGLAVIHTFGWSWTPGEGDLGLHYVTVKVEDSHGASDERTLVLLIKVNKPPVIVGCR